MKKKTYISNLFEYFSRIREKMEDWLYIIFIFLFFFARFLLVHLKFIPFENIGLMCVTRV